ncbi:hypothetical protein MAR_034536 [Mya arenaria]|uniref:Uncharacterized protein n=1 Tax=Mya arenaria TaxID=6604 RepID=A0ABY7GEL1_MYAAR|nr:hypothetical protein MAR_034536 [Mya arenaria]
MERTYLFLGNLYLSYAVAFVVSLAFESPMKGLEKVVRLDEERTARFTIVPKSFYLLLDT